MRNACTATVTLADAVAISSTNVVNSSSLPMDQLSLVAIVVTTTSTATGAAKLQGTVDNSTWVDLPNSGSTANLSISGAGSLGWNVSDLAWRSIRVVYTNATNSGTLTVKAFAKAG